VLATKALNKKNREPRRCSCDKPAETPEDVLATRVLIQKNHSEPDAYRRDRSAEKSRPPRTETNYRTTEPPNQMNSGRPQTTTMSTARTDWTLCMSTTPPEIRITADYLRTKVVNAADEVIQDLDILFSQMRDTMNRLRDERQSLKDRVEAKDRQIDTLILERDNLKDAYVQLSLSARGGTPGSDSKKSTKLADPEPLSDGVEPTFDQWISRIKNKLSANADHYPTESLKIAYIENRTKGDAARHLEPRMRENHPERYQTAEEIFDHLREIYLDPNKLLIAKADFRKLFMKNNDDYHQFHTKFMHLAGEAEIPKNDYKEEFLHKLSFELQRTVATVFMLSNTFDEFQKHCSSAAHTLKMINAKSKTSTNKPPVLASKKEPKAIQTTQTTSSRENQTPDREKMMREGICFYCKEPGHIALICPKRKKATEMKEIENQNESENELP
jgi:hypothetical protein